MCDFQKCHGFILFLLCFCFCFYFVLFSGLRMEIFYKKRHSFYSGYFEVS